MSRLLPFRDGAAPLPSRGGSRVAPRRAVISGLALALICSGWPTAGAAAEMRLAQHGITWTFDREYPSGHFANGDYWVVGPVTIVSITPASPANGERVMHGSMVNPAVGSEQGYDSAAYGPASRRAYRSELNVASGLSRGEVLRLAPGSSLVSTISHDEPGNRPQLKSAAILTVLAAPAPPGSFRPPYTGDDKTLRWNTGHLDTSLLPRLRKVPNTPAVKAVTQRFERPWLEHNTSWLGGFLHPSENQPHYGRDMANQLADGLLLLTLDLPAKQKDPLLIRLVQYGIDIYGVARAGGVWVDDGGHNLGRKLPLLLAARVMGDDRMREFGDARRHLIFQEDRQTWTVTPEDVGRPLLTSDRRKREPYLPEDVGVAEWGEKHTSQPERDGRNWDTPYRDVVGHAFLGHALAARLLGLAQDWNWPSFFDYTERYWQRERRQPTGGGNRIRPFVHAMWSTYGNQAGAPNSREPEAGR